MGVLVSANLREFTIMFGPQISWQGPCEITVGKPEARGADGWPDGWFSDAKVSMAFRVKDGSSLDESLLITGADDLQKLADEKGYSSPENDLACVTHHRMPGSQYLRVTIFLAAEKFRLVDDLLQRYSETGRKLVFGFSFAGFRTAHFDESVRPSLQEFERGVPYLVREELNFSLLPAK